MTHLGNTVRFLATLRSDGTAAVLPVAITDLPRIVEEEQAAGAHVVGDFADFRDADRVVRHSRRSRSRLERRKTA